MTRKIMRKVLCFFGIHRGWTIVMEEEDLKILTGMERSWARENYIEGVCAFCGTHRAWRKDKAPVGLI